jgi:hypothetical protein
MTDQPCGKHSRIVQDKQIARAQMFAKPREGRVLDCTSVSWKHQEPRLSSLGGRTLGDQFLRQIEIEIAGA